MASDLISRYAAIEALWGINEHKNSLAYRLALMKLLDVPSVDAVEVVRCKDCKYRDNVDECPMTYYENIWNDSEGHIEGDIANLTEDDGFCHRGVKKDAD